MQAMESLDVLVVGAGIGGVTALYYARRAGLKTLVLEKEAVVGGLWARLPAWQDIQNSRHDWTMGDLPIGGEDSGSIAANIRAWVERFDLAPSILLNTPVIRAKSSESGWLVSTPERDFVARYLVAATGAHNRPFVPPVERRSPAVRELHSSALENPEELAGRSVVVVGGGASAYDLLDLCFEHGARRVSWVYRSLKWMTPTRKPKHQAADIRALARLQMLDTPVDQISQAINQDLRSRYEKFGIQEICPREDFDIRRDQLIPGRRRLIENFARIERHRGEVACIDEATVRFTSGERVDADLLLWGTGYEIDLGYFDLPELAQTRRIGDMARRCGSLFVSRDAPRLYFLAPGILESTAVTPWCYAHASRSIVSHMLGKASLDTMPVDEKISFFDLAKFLAARDPGSFSPEWKSEYLQLATDYPQEAPLPIP